MLTFEQFSKLLDDAEIVLAGRSWAPKEFRPVDLAPPIELTVPQAKINKLESLAKIAGGHRLRDFIGCAFVGGLKPSFNGEVRFWVEFESTEAWYESYIKGFDVKCKDYDDNGNYTEKAQKKLKRMGFKRSWYV